MSMASGRAWSALGQGLANIGAMVGDKRRFEQERADRLQRQTQDRTDRLSATRDEQLSKPGAMGPVESYVPNHPDEVTPQSLADLGNASITGAPQDIVKFNPRPPTMAVSPTGPKVPMVTAGGPAISLPVPQEVPTPAPYTTSVGVVMDPEKEQQDKYRDISEEARIRHQYEPPRMGSPEWEAAQRLTSDLETQRQIAVANATGMTERNKGEAHRYNQVTPIERMPMGVQMLQKQVDDLRERARLAQGRLTGPSAALLQPDARAQAEGDLAAINQEYGAAYGRLTRAQSDWMARNGMAETGTSRTVLAPQPQTPWTSLVNPNAPRPVTPMIGAMAAGAAPTPPPATPVSTEPIAPTSRPTPEPGSPPASITAPATTRGPMAGGYGVSYFPPPGGPAPVQPAVQAAPAPAASAPTGPAPDLVSQARQVRAAHPDWGKQQVADELRRMTAKAP